jgi:hypothetical protein
MVLQTHLSVSLYVEYIASPVDMDMSYARRVRTASHSSHTSHSVSHKWRHAAGAMRAHNVLYNSTTVEMNRCSFRRVRFALLYIVTRSKKYIYKRHAQHCNVWHVYVLCVRHPWSDASTTRQKLSFFFKILSDFQGRLCHSLLRYASFWEISDSNPMRDLSIWYQLCSKNEGVCILLNSFRQAAN